MTTIYSVARCVFRKLFFGALCHLFLSQTEKTRENTQKGSTSVRCHCQMLADTQKLVDSWEKYDFSYFIENSDKKHFQFQTFQIKLWKFRFFAGVDKCLGVNQHLAVAPKQWQTPFLFNITFVCTFSWKKIYRWFSIHSCVVVGLVIPSK